MPFQEPVFHEVIQDSHGYLWLGSPGGLFRFDGKAFNKYYPVSDTTEPHVTAVFEDKEGNIWFGCKDGSISFLSANGIHPFTPEEGTSSVGISDILKDDSGVLWWSTYGEGIYYYTGDRVYNIDEQDGLSENYIYELNEDRQGRICAATDNGISVVWLEDGKKMVDIPVEPGRLPDIIVKSMKRDPSGRLWLGFHDSGAGFLKEETMQVIQPVSFRQWESGPVDNMVFSGEVIWTGFANGRILQVYPEQPDLTLSWDADDRGNSFGRIHELLQDQEGNIWILASGGLFRSTGTRIQFLSGSGYPSIHDVHSLTIDSEENLLYCNNEGVFRHDFPSRSTKNILQVDLKSQIHFMCLEEDPYGYIWAGTFDHGLFRIDPSSGRYRQITEKEGLVNDNVLSISSHRDTLWTATLGGASSLVLQGPALNSDIAITSFNQDNGLVNTFIYDVYEDHLNRIWFATDGDGICVLSEGSFTYFDEEDGLGDDVIYSVTGDTEGNIWFSTSADGVYRYDGKTFSHFGTGEGLRSLEISSLAVQGDEVVVVHGLGIDVIHLPDMLISSYGRESGLLEMTPELNSIYADTRGNVWAGTKTGIIRYQNASDDIVYAPRTIIEKMSVFLQPVKMSDNLSLKASQDHVSFHYSGIWLSDPDEVVFSIFLEGYDLDWKETYDRVATFSNLRPGDYTFHVRSALDGSFIRYSEATYSFSIKRPVWATPWFIVIITSLLALMIYLMIKNREKKLKAIEEKKKEKVEYEFQLLKNQVNPHFLFNSFSTLISLIEENDKMAMEYTERLSDFFRRVLQLKENEVIPLAEELELIEDYLFIQQKRYGDLIKMDNQLKGNVLQSFIPPMTLQILMENAVKHNIISREQNLFIYIFQEDDYLIVENSFQPKRKTEESTGIGLENISKRYRFLTGKDIVISQTGSLFRVKLPVI